MIHNYLLLAVRNLLRNLVFTSINLTGLCLGMTAFVLIAQYITFETSYNSFHADLPRMYRTLNEKADGNVELYTAPGFAPMAASQFPAIDQFCRLAEGANLGTGIVTYGKDETKDINSFRENNFVYADGNFFSFFSFPVIHGRPDALSNANVVAMSRSTSIRYFGDASALGKEITLSNQFGKTIYVVGAVYEDMPDNSDLQYDIVFSIQTLYNPANLDGNESWASMEGTGSQWLLTYLRLKDGANADDVAHQYTQLLHQVNPDDESVIRLQGVGSMHLGASLSDTLPAFGSLKFIYLLTGISVLILVIAWFNYVNLSTASALRRAKEVGIRKVIGASRTQLIIQFLGESALLNAVAFGLSLALVGVLQVPYTSLIDKKLSLDILGDRTFWISAGAILLVGTIASGAYTALVMSAFNPATVLKGIFSRSGKGIVIRKSLVVIQFSISLMLMASTIILFQQWKYMENKDLGMNASQLVVVRGAEVNKDKTFVERSSAFEREIRSAAFVDAFSRSGNVPSEGFNFSTSGITRMNPASGDEEINYDILTIDDHYLDTYAIDIAAGNNFTTEMCNTSWNKIGYLLLNERAAEQMGFGSPQEAVGQKVKWDDRLLEVRGVVKDYHHLSVQFAIGPIVFLPSAHGSYYTLRVPATHIPDHLATLEGFFIKSFPGNPFEFHFLDDTFASRYYAERQYSVIFTLASALAIVIGCLGLFGLVTYSIDQRTKEIGVRKVMGSSVTQIVRLLSMDFIRLVLIACIIAVPLCWWSMNQWLQGFAYHITIQSWMFGAAGLVTVLLAWGTVAIQAFKGAKMNPVDSLRNE